MKIRSPRARALRARRIPEGRAGISEFSWRFLNDQVTREQAAAENMRKAFSDLNGGFIEGETPYLPKPSFAPEGRSAAELWGQFGQEIVKSWARERPGRRPRCWWAYSAPRPGMRARVGGVGMLHAEHLGWDGTKRMYAPIVELGLPCGWILADEVRWLLEHHRPRSEAVAIDPADLPLFEAQASFLKRLGLLLPGEARRLKPADFEHERLPPELITDGLKAREIPWLARLLVARG